MDLTRADLTRVDLTCTGLFGANLSNAMWSTDVPVPEGWKPDTGPGRLKRAGTDSGSTKAKHPPPGGPAQNGGRPSSRPAIG